MALFFADNAVAYWNRTLRTIAGQYLTDSGDTARMFALVNMAMADALLNAWASKQSLQFLGDRSPPFGLPTQTAIGGLMQTRPGARLSRRPTIPSTHRVRTVSQAPRRRCLRTCSGQII